MSASGNRPSLSDPQTLVLECSICTEQYGQDFDHIPRSLRCGHTFSSSCLVRILMSKGVKCPICGVNHPLPTPDVTQIPVNYAVLEIIRNICDTSRDRLDPVDDTTPRCQVCSTKNAQVACIDCQPGVKFLFCHTCDQQEHNRPFKPVQGHRRYPVDRVPMAVYVCSRHRNNQAILFSENLFEFACEDCKKDPDWLTRSTMFDAIPDVLHRLRSHSQKLNVYSLNVISQLKDAKHKMKVIIENLDPSASKAKQDIQVKFGAIMDLIQTRQQELLDYVENESVIRKQRLQEQLEEIVTSLKTYRDAYEDLNTLVSKSDLDFLLSYQVITGKVEALLAREDKSLHQPAVTEEIPFFIAKDIEQQLKTLGAVGGGITPIDLECVANSKGNMMKLNWQLSISTGRLLHFQIEYEHLPDISPFNKDSSQMEGIYIQGEPQVHQVTGNELSTFVDYLCPGYQYRFRIRSANAAGWGMWSKPVTGRCEDFPIAILFTKRLNRIRIPSNGYYRITAKGAKAADGKMHCGGTGAVITATFYLRAGDVLIILCGGMSVLQKFSTGGGGGTFVAVNEINQDNLLIAAGGGGGTRGVDENDFNGCDASLEPSGLDGQGREHGKGGVSGGPGQDANPDDYQTPCWGHGGAGFLQDSNSASSFLKGGHGGQCGGFGGGGAIGQYGGGGGGGYSGGGGGRGGGGGGSYVRDDGLNITKAVGNDSNGMVAVEKVQFAYPDQVNVKRSDSIMTTKAVVNDNYSMVAVEKVQFTYPDQVNVKRSDSNVTTSSGYVTMQQSQLLRTQHSQASSHSSTNDTKVLQSILENMSGSKSPEEPPSNRTPSSHSSPLNTGFHEPQVPATNMKPVQEIMTRDWISDVEAQPTSDDSSTSISTLVERSAQLDSSRIHITHTNDRNASAAPMNRVAPPIGQNHPPVGQNHPPVGQNHPPAGQNHPPAGQNHPPAGQNHPPAGQNHPPAGQNHPPAGQNHPPAGQNHPPAGQNHPPAGQNHPPAGQNHPPAGQNHPPVGQNHPPAGQNHPPAGQNHPPVGQNYPPAGQNHPPAGQNHPPAGQNHPPAGQNHPPVGQNHPQQPLQRN